MKRFLNLIAHASGCLQCSDWLLNATGLEALCADGRRILNPLWVPVGTHVTAVSISMIPLLSTGVTTGVIGEPEDEYERRQRG